MAIDIKLRQKLKSTLRHFVRKKCWDVAAGGPYVGSMFSLHCGRRVPYPAPSTLKGKVPRFEGEYILFVGEAAWRIERGSKILFSSENRGEDMTNGLARLVGKIVRSAKVCNTSYDLRIEFSSNYALSIFCSQTDDRNGCNNYSVHDMDEVLVIGAKSMLSLEKR
jgi:hypothetical protein